MSDTRFISFDASGMRVWAERTSTPLSSLLWSEVIRVEVFKRDQITVDCICMAFFLSDDTVLVPNEEMVGWKELTEALPNYLPGCMSHEEWFCTVAFPAFATNLTEIFRRSQ